MQTRFIAILALVLLGSAQAGIPSFTPRWQLDRQGIVWKAADQHADEIEMSGRQVSAVIAYGREADGRLKLKRTIVWPMLRTIPDDTHASLIREFSLDAEPTIRVNGQPAIEKLRQVRFDGQLQLQSDLGDAAQLTRLLSPSPGEPVLLERMELRNTGRTPLRYEFTALAHGETTPASAGTHGAYRIQASAPARSGTLAPGAHVVIDASYRAQLANEMVYVDSSEELRKRADQVRDWNSKLVLESPDPALDRMFGFAKLRAAESIFATRGGLLHSPGGKRYYAAIWANDEAEYANPFFPYLGDAAAIEAATNSYRLFAGFMNVDWKPIPSSIIAEGRDIWNGAGDRGDCAMIAYGASHFALAQGDTERARQLLPLIDWCNAYNARKRTADGIIASDSDELEGRFPAGKANLSTNVLAYGGMVGADRLHKELGGTPLDEDAAQLRKAIVAYFGANVGGYETWRYYDGNDKLRAWIALPLCFGITERQQGTVEALLSAQLWSENGVLTEAGDKTFWDRATLYAFRGLMQAGELQRVFPYFSYYSKRRLLGEHVPYAIEAWPEGNQRHLSAESALYARVVIEGLFGIEPTGLRSFRIAPRLPQGWPKMALRNVRAFGVAPDSTQGLDIVTRRSPRGQRVEVSLYGKTILRRDWDGKQPFEVRLPE